MKTTGTDTTESANPFGGLSRALGVAASFAMVAAQVAPLPLPGITVVGIAPAAAQYNARPVSITCYSQGNSARTCRLPENTQSVSFVGPDRTGRCREGETWRRQGNSLRVSGGCGGTFEAMVYQGGGSSGGNWGGSGGNNQGFAGEISCRSRENRTERCSANTQSRVQMLQQYSSSPCIEGQTWSYTRNRIEVRNGCQARFGYGYGNWNEGGSSGWGGSNQGFANQIECRSDNNRYRRCTANTEGRVEMMRQLSSSTCVQGRSWGYDRNSIWVDNGCQARFGYGYGNWNSGGGSGWGGSNQGFANQIECRSDNDRYRRCSANTQGRVEMLRQLSSSSCVQGRSWGYDRNSIWVDNGCRARFGYGYGNQTGDTSGDSGGSNTGAVIGGVALAAGLIALLAAAGKSGSSKSSASTTAAIDADLARFPSDARGEAQLCMNEAARQVGSTGGTRVALDRVDQAQRSGDGWMLVAQVTGTWPDHRQAMTMDCRANGSKVTGFDIR